MAYLVGNKRNDAGLVLHIDPANIKCFRGEPTINVFYLNGFNPLDIYTWANTGYQMILSRDLSIKSPLGGIVLKILTNGNSAYVNSYYSNYYNLSAASSGQTWTFSYYFKAPVGARVGGYIMGVDVDGHYVDLLKVMITATGNWQRYSHTYTFTNANVVAIQTRIDIYTAYVTVYIDAVQVEQKDHATHFTSTSRGTTTTTNGGLKDLSTLLNNATITNTLQYINNTMYFNGTSDVVLIPSSSSINFTGADDYTMVAWVKPVTGGVTWYGVFSKGNENSYAMNINSSTWYLQFEIYGTGSRSLDTTTNVITPNAWNFIVMLYDGVTQKIFVNGILLNSQSKILGTYGNNSDLRIGLGNDGEYFKGYMGDLRIYNRGLRDDEVVSMYNSSKYRYI